MIDTANGLPPKQGRPLRLMAAAGAWLRALDYSSFDYTRDRIGLLEEKVAKLTEELRGGSGFRPSDSVSNLRK